MHVVHLAEALDPTRFRTRLITGRITSDEGDMTYYARERGVVRSRGPLRPDFLAFGETAQVQPLWIRGATTPADRVGRVGSL